MATSSLRRQCSLSLLAIITLLLLALAPGLALAQEQPAQLGLRPVPAGEKGYFELTLEPGTTRELTVELGNYGTSPARAHTYAADIYSLVNGGMGIGLAGAASGPTTWLSYPPETLTLEGRKAILRTFNVTVPPDAQPGEYLTSIVIEGSPELIGGGGGTQVKQVLRQAIAVSIDIPGPRRSELTVGAISEKAIGGQSVVSIELRNTGNVRVRPGGLFVLRDASGAEISRYELQLNSIYAGTATQIEIPFAGALPIGGYSASLELSDPEAGLAPVTAAPDLAVVAPTAVPTAPESERQGPAPINLPTPAAGEAGDAPAATSAGGPLGAGELVFGAAMLALLAAVLVPALRRRGR